MRDYLPVRAAFAVAEIRLRGIQGIAEIRDIGKDFSVGFRDQGMGSVESRIRGRDAFVNVIAGKEEVDLFRIFSVDLQKEVFDSGIGIRAE